MFYILFINNLGSSGAPLYDASTRRVLGVLTGGAASCLNRYEADAFGMLSRAFDKDNVLRHLLAGDTGMRFADGADLEATHKLENHWKEPKSGSVVDALGIFEIELIPDMFPDEVLWTLHDPNGDGIASGVGSSLTEISGPSEGEQYMPFSPVYLSIPGRYRFTIYDRNEDGLCCSFGVGTYSIKVNGKEIYSSDGKYDAKETFTFEIDSDTKPKTYTLLDTVSYGTLVVNVNVRDGAAENVWALISPDNLIYAADHMNSRKEIDLYKCGLFKIVLLDSKGDGLNTNDSFTVKLDNKEVANGQSFLDVKVTTFMVPCSSASEISTDVEQTTIVPNTCKKEGETCRRARRECCNGLRCVRVSVGWGRSLRCI